MRLRVRVLSLSILTAGASIADAFSPGFRASPIASTVSLASSAAESGSDAATASDDPWAPATWTFTLNLGREAGTNMPEDWGASGGRLAVPLNVIVSPDRPLGDTRQQDPMLQRNTFQLLPQTSPVPTYITTEGEKEAQFGNVGEWKIRLPSGSAQGHAAKLMCYVDLKTRIQKNDVVLNKGERIYLTAKCWREEELERAAKLFQPIALNYQRKQERLEEALEHVSGDRRLDGVDPIQTLMGMKDTAQLVMSRDAARDEFDEAMRVYPNDLGWVEKMNPDAPMKLSADDLSIDEGPWPGQIEWLSVEPLFAMVRRTKLFGGEEYNVVGTWSISPNIPEEDGDQETSVF
mmetsp:Transcript_20860/g.58000  ORF Transcript_20860/g.58000 Transcript_20860/m.58000 type:complete len:348 (-) Transcript_20860:663-1706(-)